MLIRLFSFFGFDCFGLRGFGGNVGFFGEKFVVHDDEFFHQENDDEVKCRIGDHAYGAAKFDRKFLSEQLEIALSQRFADKCFDNDKNHAHNDVDRYAESKVVDCGKSLFAVEDVAYDFCCGVAYQKRNECIDCLFAENPRIDRGGVFVY